MARFVIDTDTAGDDVTSLLFGLRWPGATLDAITVAAGNVFLDQAVRNALLTIEVAGRPDVPVYAGAGRPLVRDLVTAHYVHGDDGMGDSGLPGPGATPADGFAPDAIVEHARRHPGELELIAQAPLTNIALALLEEPQLPRLVRRLWIMGGVNNSLGNITPAAEFNFYVDPEAAHIVLRAGFDVVLVPWDVCLADGILVRDELAPVLAMGTELSEFYLAVNRRAWEFMRTHAEGGGIDGITHPDSLMMAMAIDDAVIAERGRYFVDVEHRGELTRGYSLVDRNAVLDEEPNAVVVRRAEHAVFRDMLYAVLRG
jgi:purine nucleosidase